MLKGQRMNKISAGRAVRLSYVLVSVVCALTDEPSIFLGVTRSPRNVYD